VGTREQIARTAPARDLIQSGCWRCRRRKVSCAKAALRRPAPSGTPSSRICEPEAPSRRPESALSFSAVWSSFQVVSNCAAVRHVTELVQSRKLQQNVQAAHELPASCSCITAHIVWRGGPSPRLVTYTLGSVVGSDKFPRRGWLPFSLIGIYEIEKGPGNAVPVLIVRESSASPVAPAGWRSYMCFVGA